MKVYGVLVSSLIFATGFACSKSKSSSSTSSTESIESVNGLAVAYPDSLALSVFPTSTTTTLALGDDATPDQIVDRPPADRIAENEKMLKGDGSVECFQRGLFAPPTKEEEEGVSCYQFDSDMDPRTEGSKTFGTEDGKVGTGDNKEEACMVAFARTQAKIALRRFEMIQAIAKGMLCQAKKDGMDTTPPAKDEKKDLKSAMANASGKDMPVTKAMMTGLEIDGKPAYQIDVVMKDPRGNEMEVHLVNQQVLDEDGTKIGDVGTAWSRRPAKAGFRQGVQKDDDNSVNKSELLSIKYQVDTKEGEKNQRVEVQRASIVNTIDKLFTEDGAINFEAVSKTAARSTIHDVNFLSFDLDPDTAEGTMSYWMNPTFDSSARGFLFSSTEKDGKLSGCGVSGATADISIRKALIELKDPTALKPAQFWHPFANINTNPHKDSRYGTSDKGPLVTEQCFAQNSDGIYAIDTSVTKHERGYDVIAKGKMTVEPPRAPAKKLDVGTASLR